MDSNGRERFDSGDSGNRGDSASGNGSARRLRRTLSYFIVPFCIAVTGWTFTADYMGHPIGAETRNVMLGVLAALLGLFTWQHLQRE